MSSLHTRLERLLEKYLALLELRLKREKLESAGILRLEGAAGAERRAALRALAAEFPGCLRELEHLPSRALAIRLEDVRAELAALLSHPQRRLPQRDWVRVMLDYHAALRAGLAQRRDVCYVPPSVGRRQLSQQVLDDLAQRYGLPRERIRRLLFGAPEPQQQ